MGLTVQMLVGNNRTTILNAIKSVEPIADEILIADIGSDDGSISLCNKYQVFRFGSNIGYDEVRMALVSKSRNDWQFYLQPWEILAQGHREIIQAEKTQRLNILQGSLLTKEVRMWKKSSGLKFCNPIYEYLEDENAELSSAYIFSNSNPDYCRNLDLVQQWKKNQPFSSSPFYYQALSYLALGRYEDFLNSSEHYMFLDTKKSISTIMNRYYYALVQIIHCRKVKPALQNLNLCIEHRPLMAEFWCLIGDIYYHLYNKYSISREFYENALVLGGRRLSDDVWPMDISKYDEYPNKMIKSCDELCNSKSLFAPIN